MLTLIKDNVEYSLDDGTYGYLIGYQGWGMLPLHRMSERGPLQDGDTDRGYRADPRFGNLLFEILGDSLYDLYDRKQKIMDLFDPDSQFNLKWHLVHPIIPDSYIDRQFDIVLAGDMDFPSSNKKGFAQKVSVKLKAPNPTCYDPNRMLIEYSGGGGSGFVVPVTVPMTFGMSSFDIIQSIYNSGNIADYPEITLVGPLTNPIITNVSYNEKIDITGNTIGAGYTWVIDTRYSHKTVIELPNVNKLDKLTSDSDLSTFRLRKKYNDIRVQATGITSASKVQIRYYNRYTGV